MKLIDRIFHIEAEMERHPQKPTILIPVEAVKTLIRHHRKYTDLQEKMKKYRTDSKYYREAYESAKAENKRLQTKLKQRELVG